MFWKWFRRKENNTNFRTQMFHVLRCAAAKQMVIVDSITEPEPHRRSSARVERRNWLDLRKETPASMGGPVIPCISRRLKYLAHRLRPITLEEVVYGIVAILLKPGDSPRTRDELLDACSVYKWRLKRKDVAYHVDLWMFVLDAGYRTKRGSELPLEWQGSRNPTVAELHKAVRGVYRVIGCEGLSFDFKMGRVMKVAKALGWLPDYVRPLSD